MTIKSILVANRGEIACRIIHTAKEQGLKAFAVYSSADINAPHVKMADDAFLIGSGPVNESYLNSEKVIEAAKSLQADAIHPGYGFLSENAAFAREVEAQGITFIGPPADAIDAMGNKAEAKRLMLKANVPCVPGYQGTDQSTSTLIKEANQIGYPVMVKAAAGGGGRGMRLVHSERGIKDSINLARSEALSAFGSDELIIEKAVQNPRHVEVQIFGDKHGNIIHLGERDCSVQRRHQKVVEESPCPVMTKQLRHNMGEAAINAAKAVSYYGAGTVEFLLDENLTDFYFLEMNTRLQVEHPVTELVTGLDLVALQISVANGEPLPYSQQDIQLKGHAIEVRLYAEDPENDYMPTVGSIDLWEPAKGKDVRVDCGIDSHSEVSPFYDAMLAKIIAHGETREVARNKLVNAVSSSVLLGLTTNTKFLLDVLELPKFIEGQASTALLAEAFPNGFKNNRPSARILSLVTAIFLSLEQSTSISNAGFLSPNLLGWSSASPLSFDVEIKLGDTVYITRVRCDLGSWVVTVDAESFSVNINKVSSNEVVCTVNNRKERVKYYHAGNRLSVAINADRYVFTRVRKSDNSNDENSDDRIVAPMPGVILEIAVSKGQAVKKGTPLVFMEAMKMQHQLNAPKDCVISELNINDGQQVKAGDTLIELEDQE